MFTHAFFAQVGNECGGMQASHEFRAADPPIGVLVSMLLEW